MRRNLRPGQNSDCERRGESLSTVCLWPWQTWQSTVTKQLGKTDKRDCIKRCRCC